MRLTSVFMLAACMQVSAHVHSQTVSFSGKNVPLEKIFAVVEKQTGYVFFYDESILKNAHPVTIRAENDPLDLFLTRVLMGQPYGYSFQNKTIVISRKESAPAFRPRSRYGHPAGSRAGIARHGHGHEWHASSRRIRHH